MRLLKGFIKKYKNICRIRVFLFHCIITGSLGRYLNTRPAASCSHNSNKNRIKYSNDVDMANILNLFFTEQTVLDETNVSLPSGIPPSMHTFEPRSEKTYLLKCVQRRVDLNQHAHPRSLISLHYENTYTPVNPNFTV